ncbi:histidine--tRNA ligase [Treponema rectale]|uniref:Histidine--tRNA ligase n=1 Tax=Treponema rectale TaxID=744512 RepID=A0A7M1XNL3_9SPIR|nr:histidine--tRNA ligase [Treponema rectale]
MAIQQIKKPRGTIDYYGEDMKVFAGIREILLAEADKYGTEFVELPMFEENGLFHRTVGESSDIVTKETFDLAKRGDKDYTLRPEFTASVSRAVIENKIYTAPDMPIRLSYFGPVFRYERPQTGRLRQFNQFGVEFLDSKVDLSTTLDAFLLSLRSAEKLLGHKVKAKINFLGSFESREKYKVELKKFFEPKIEHMCEDCKRRLETNPLRILDCKVPEDQEIAKGSPRVTDFLNDEDQKEFSDIKKALDALDIEYVVDSELVRGLDYYTGLVWELYDTLNDSLGAIGGGGKYASLMASIGGPDFEGIGFSLGVERLMIALTEERKSEIKKEKPLDVFIIDFKREGKANYFADKLRQSGLNVSIASFNRALGGALKMADRKGAKKVLIVDSDDTFKIKDMASRNQIEVKEEEVLSSLGE